MQRACAAALLAKGTSVIKRPGESNDDLAALDVIQKLGAKVERRDNGDLVVTSDGINPGNDEINCGESGLGIRMFTPLVALSNRRLTVSGEGSLVTRPMSFFDEILPKLHVNISSNNGKVPLIIQGPLEPANIEIDGSLSSQFLTGLLMAFGAAGASDKTITVRDLKSKPYIDLTLDVMKRFGVKVDNHNHKEYYFTSTNQGFQPSTYEVEGDWSGAAFLLVSGAIAGRIKVTGLDPMSTQADKAILTALSMCGAELSVRQDEIVIGPGFLNAFHFDATDCPDLFPPLVSLASYCNGHTVIKGVNRLKHKESDRGITLKEEFAKLGVDINLQDDLMIINGDGNLKGGVVHSRHDHRIAMACAVAGLRAASATTIEQSDAINKSYPAFFEHMKLLGARVEHELQTV